MNHQEDWKKRWYTIIFEHHTRAGRIFDEVLLVLILLSVIIVLTDSVEPVHQQYYSTLFALEWFFTLLFTFEYVIRIIVSPVKRKYIFSFYGIIDLVSIVPTYLSLIFAGAQYLIIVRLLRLLRVFRILKLVKFTRASIYLVHALKHSREKILVFFGTVLITVTIVGTLMYLIEGPESGFTSIPTSIYWAIVTITTVGFGDITPITLAGKFIASLLMLVGYAIIAVPTGIITSELSRSRQGNESQKIFCKSCGMERLADGANFCSNCGTPLPPL
ncbi:MAG TPA: ion transporter [Bacteroidales bacterium]|nr:ion transporter [Bacteroidales bacterium]